MAKYIEFLGAPAIGKTATYNHLKTVHKKNDSWIFFEKLNNKSITLKLSLFLLKTFGMKSLSVNQDMNREIIDKFIETNPRLIDQLWQTLPLKPKDLNGKDVRIHGLLLLLKTFSKIETIRETNLLKYCIVDEGIIQSSNYFFNPNLPIDFEKQISSLFDLIKMPDGLVFFDGDIDIVMKRNAMRHKVLRRDANLSLEQIIKLRSGDLERKRICYNLARSKGVPVLYLSAMESIDAKAKKILYFIDHLYAPGDAHAKISLFLKPLRAKTLA